MGKVITITLMGLIILASSCKRDKFEVNLTGIEVSLEVKRLEKDLFSIDPVEIRNEIPGLIAEYGYFLQLFSYVINTGEITTPAWYQYLNAFVTDRMNYEAHQSVMEKYDDITDLEDDLRDAFRHYLYYFPEKHVPSVYTCITGFNNSIIIGDSVLGIGLDRYLGPDCEFYEMLGIYQYLTLKMDRKNILPDCMYAWSVTEWDFERMNYGTENLFARMIHEGKLFYFARCMLPARELADIFGFTEDQLKFCSNNEGQIWTYLVEHDMLFSTDPLVIRKLTGEAPFTSYFTNESPGKAALWTGYRIVEAYMERNPSTTLRDLMEITDLQSLLSGAKYNPR
jgi:hypothetical protein